MVHVAATTRVPVRVFPDSEKVFATVAAERATVLRPRAAESQPAVLGRATDSCQAPSAFSSSN